MPCNGPKPVINPKDLKLQEGGGCPVWECIEVPKVFDECLIKRCLTYCDGPSVSECTATDKELRQLLPVGTRMEDIRSIQPCRNFNLVIKNVIRIPVRDPLYPNRNEPGFKRIIVKFLLTFDVDVILCNGSLITLPYAVNRTETVESLYCPDALSQVAARRVCNEPGSIDLDPEIVKLVIKPECLGMDFTEVYCTPNGVVEASEEDRRAPRVAVDITLGYDLIVKCELIVQLSVLSLGYCYPDPCGPVASTSPCDAFCNTCAPEFYPPQLQDLPQPPSDEGV